MKITKILKPMTLNIPVLKAFPNSIAFALTAQLQYPYLSENKRKD